MVKLLEHIWCTTSGHLNMTEYKTRIMRSLIGFRVKLVIRGSMRL